MAITTGAAVWEFGSSATAISDAADASDPQFTVVGDGTQFVNSDNAPLADFELSITCNTAPTAGDAVHLYRQDLNMVGSTQDAPFPDANFKNTYVGSFPLDLVTSQQFISLTDVPISADQNFAIEYDLTATNGTVTNSTVVKIIPKTYNAKAA